MFIKKDFLAKMSKLSGIQLDLYHIWEIADHIMVNLPNGLEITDWEKENMGQIMYLNDLTFYVDFITKEMGQLVSGLRFFEFE